MASARGVIATRVGGIPRLIRGIGQYRRERRGPITTTFAECGGFLKTRHEFERA